MVIKIRNLENRSLSLLSKSLYEMVPRFRRVPLDKFIRLSSIQAKYHVSVTILTFFKEALNSKKSLVVMLNNDTDLLIHPDTFLRVIKKRLEARLKAAIRDIDKRILHTTGKAGN